jgi:Glutamyl-tRNAGlu reductase, N-terminal domain
MPALGVDHRSSTTSVPEAPAFEGERRRCGLDALKAEAPDFEFILLSTCNRVDLYAAAETAPPDLDAPTSSLAPFHVVSIELLDSLLSSAFHPPRSCRSPFISCFPHTPPSPTRGITRFPGRHSGRST